MCMMMAYSYLKVDFTYSYIYLSFIWSDELHLNMSAFNDVISYLNCWHVLLFTMLVICFSEGNLSSVMFVYNLSNNIFICGIVWKYDILPAPLHKTDFDRTHARTHCRHLFYVCFIFDKQRICKELWWKIQHYHARLALYILNIVVRIWFSTIPSVKTATLLRMSNH